MDEEKRKKQIVNYAVAVLALLILVVFCLIWENPFSAENAKDAVMKLCNSFTVPGVVIAGVGGLSYLSSLGAYDGISYAFSNFALHNIWTSKQPKKYKNFYEYKTAKDEKGRAWLPHFLIVGTISLAVSIILLIVYLIL